MIRFLRSRGPPQRALIETGVLALLLLSLTALIGISHYLLDLKKFREVHQEQEDTVVKRAQTVLEEVLSKTIADARFLAETAQHIGVPVSLGDARTEMLAAQFSALNRQRPMYDQIRLLGYRGREVVRVNYHVDGPRIVKRQKLQDKSKRYYFVQARDLNAGEIYISPVDVNIEWGQVEQIPRPMFRVATPVFDDNGHRRGVILINYQGQALAEIFKNAIGSAGERLMVVDNRSYWLSNPRQELESGFVYDPDARFKNYYPEVWKRMTQHSAGTHVDRRGVFTFARLDLQKMTGVADSPGSSWFIVALFPSVLLRLALGQSTYLVAYGLLCLLGLISVAGFGMARIRQLRALDRLVLVEPMGRALESTANPVVVTNPMDRIVFVNNAVLEHTGYSRQELLGHDRIDTLVTPAAGEASRARLRGLTTGKLEPDVFDAGLQDRNGNNYRVAWSESLQRDVSGEVTGVTYIGEVPRSGLQNDEWLRNLAAATEQSPVTVMITDTDGHIEYVNPRFSALTGYSNEEVIGRKPSILKSGETPPEDYRQLWSNLKAGREWQGVFNNFKKNGQSYLEATTISPLRDEGGEVTHFLALKEDITERTRLEKNFQLAVEAAPSAMILTNPQGIMVLTNSRAEEMFGYTREEMHGQSLDMLVPDEARQAHAGLRRRYADAAIPRPMGSGVDLHGKHRDGHVFPVDIGLNPIEAGEETMVLSSVVDLSERRALKDQLEERDRQVVEAHALATVGRMAAMVAHDLRNPLSSVKMGLQILNRSSSKGHGKGDQELQQIALDQVQYMEKILSELLSYAKPTVLNREWLTISKIIDRAVLLCEKEIQRHHIRLKVWNQLSLPTLYGDPHRLQQAISNLITNAIESCVEAGIGKGEISVRSHLDLGEDIPRVCIEIIDNGVGLDHRTESKVFEPFFTSRAKGTGLGLTIVRQIIAAHGGTATLSNEPGGGARARVNLPTRPLTEADQTNGPTVTLRPDSDEFRMLEVAGTRE
ncbi:MAG TPA: PAS domain S-box protein [Arenicellales bacterium]|nr:PAS domain S-box protein [Arenicellales bacterium]